MLLTTIDIVKEGEDDEEKEEWKESDPRTLSIEGGEKDLLSSAKDSQRIGDTVLKNTTIRLETPAAGHS